MVEFHDKANSNVISDNIGRLSDDKGTVICQMIRYKAIVGTGKLKGKSCFLVHIMIKKNVLPHTKTFTHTQVVK